MSDSIDADIAAAHGPPLARDAALTFRVPFGVSRTTGRILHVSQVPRGRACDCVCPTCERPLQARKGERKAHHFGHDHQTECLGGFETALHLYAKQLIADERRLIVPDPHGREETRKLRFTAVEQEVYDPASGLTPDLVGWSDEHALWIEIVVTHAASDAKIAHLADADQSAIEINLSRVSPEVSKAELDAAILRDAPRRWLYSRPAERARRDREAEAQRRAAAAAEKKRREEERRREASIARVERAIGVLSRRGGLRPSDRMQAVNARDAVREMGFADLIRTPPCPEVFKVHHHDWQSRVILALPKKPSRQLIKAVWDSVSRHVVRDEFLYLTLEEHDRVGERVPRYIRPYHMIRDFVDTARGFETFVYATGQLRAAEIEYTVGKDWSGGSVDLFVSGSWPRPAAVRLRCERWRITIDPVDKDRASATPAERMAMDGLRGLLNRPGAPEIR